MRKVLLLFACLGFLSMQVFAQRTITGTVTGADDGMSLPGVSVTVKGSTMRTITDADGAYSISAPADATTLVFEFMGMETQEVPISGDVVNAAMKSSDITIDDVVVTALGITREKKSIGYAVQTVSGDKVNTVQETNFVNSLSGKVSGVQIKPSNTMGGSANIVIRGNSSLLNNNQALFVVDGVPIDNSNTNSTDQMRGAGGYDYGNAAMDINPEDIESISVLKGSASAALYGSRAANGVVLITTKKGSQKKGIGVSIKSSVQWSKFDEKTMPVMQKEYGAGYADYFDYADLNGDGVDEEICPTYDDASFGAKFDPNRMVVQWMNLNPTSPTYGVATPWVAGENDFRYFFETGVNFTNSVAIDGSSEKGTFRLSYTNSDEKGQLPVSSFKKNTLSFTGTLKVNEKLSFEANANYYQNYAKGRYGTGYDAANPVSSFAEWFQVNVDFKDLKENWITPAGRQLGWNIFDPTSTTSEAMQMYYWDNPYWIRHKSYQNDGRNRFMGYAKLKYEIIPGLLLEARISDDFYAEIQEERWASGSSISNGNPYYTKFERNFNELNAEGFLRYNKVFSDFSVTGLLGASYRKNEVNSTNSATAGGLAIPDFYAISNSVAAATVTETDVVSAIASGFGNASLGYKNMIYLDLTARVDKSSTLPVDKDTYFYPSVALGFILSELPGIKDLGFLSFSKIRANYAEVGNAAPAYILYNVYDVNKPWVTQSGTQPNNSVSGTLFNPDLKSESSQTIELGFESRFINDRIGFDIALYKKNSFDQIIPISVSRAAGLSSMYKNIGEIENKGIEVTLSGKPVVKKDFSWDIIINWFANRSMVVDLGGDIDNIPLFGAWDVSVNASQGEPYGAIKGRNYVFVNGQKVVYTEAEELAGDGLAGMYKKSENDEVLGNINPDWNAGITNTLTFKGITFSALIDIQHGGDIYSVNRKYGMSTGLYEETAGLNDKGNPKRDPVAEGGGILYEGVYSDGTPNTTYIETIGDRAYNYNEIPTAHYIYDASYVKLREVSLSYKLPMNIIKKTPLTGVEVSLVGRNLWIIHKNTPGFDPEAALSSGNLQGIEYGNYPATKTYGFNIKVNF